MVDTTEFNLVPNNEEEEFTVNFGEVIRLAGSSDFNQLQNRPQYDGQVMTGETDIPKVPTATSELNNDSDYQTGSEVQQTINAAIANKQDKLTAGQNITISEQNVISATGLTEVDWGDIGGNLNDQIDLKDVLDAKQDTLTPGDNVTIANNIISATDTKYTAGNGLSLNGTQFSADTAVLQEKLDAGNAITIENDTINADIYPADFFTNEATATDTGSNITLDKTIPATLKSVELYGDTEQQAYSGKNLYGMGQETSVGANITWTKSGNTANGTGTSSSTWCYIQSANSTFTNNLTVGTYTMSIAEALPSPLRLQLHCIKSDNSAVNYTMLANATSLTFTTTDVITAANIAVTGLTSTETYDITIKDFQLEAGSTPTTYEPYVGGVPAPNPNYPQDVNVVTGEQTVTVVGKNLLDVPDGTLTVRGITFDRTDNTIVCSGAKESIGNNWLIMTGGWVVLDNPILAGTYTFSISKAATKDIEFSRTYSDGTVQSSIIVAGGTSITFTTTKEITQYRLIAKSFSVGESADGLVYENIQLEAGSKATPYQPYQSQTYTVDLGSTELCKIGTYQDYIYKSGDDWYVHKETNKHTFTGSENWYLQTSGTPSILYCGSGVLSDAINSAVKTQIYSDYFHYTTGAEAGGCYLYNRSVFVFYGDTSTTASTFKTWLGDNNTTVYYPLATPTDTKITNDGLITDLNALAGAKSYLDATNFAVTATGTNLPALLKPEVYVKSLNGVLEYLSHI